MEADYQRLGDLQEDLLVEIAHRLNEIHGVDHGVRYWRILLGPWLGTLLAALADRWMVAVEGPDYERVLVTNVLEGGATDRIPSDNAQFRSMVFDDHWNHVVFGRMLQEETSIECRPVKSLDPPAESGGQAPGKPSMLEAGLAIVAHLSRMLARPTDSVLRATSMPWRTEARVQMALGQIPALWTMIPLPKVDVPPDERWRSWSLPEPGRSRFEDHVRRWASVYLPTVYLEGYRNLLEAVEQSRLPSRPRVIFTSTSQFSDEVFKAWTAEKVMNGSPLLVGQHGGHSGIGRFSATNDHEVAIADRFASWGWADNARTKVTPTGQLKGFGRLRNRSDGGGSALLMLNVTPRYGYDLYDVPVAGQWLEYHADQCEFVENLSPEVRRSLVVRLYQHDYGWDQAERWQDRFPDLAYERSTDDYLTSLERCRVAICTYNGATFLETIAMDLPTVVFWDPKRSGLATRAHEVFAVLTEVGVFHETPGSAAAHLSEVWDDVEGWWGRADVRAACDLLRGTFSRDPEGTPDRVIGLLRSLRTG
jgi:putative transferase (TIGR04331 family)